MAKVPNREIAENFNQLSRVHERYRQTDDRRTCDSIYSEVNVSSRLLKTMQFRDIVTMEC